jgi:hypothetical protein
MHWCLISTVAATSLSKPVRKTQHEHNDNSAFKVNMISSWWQFKHWNERHSLILACPAAVQALLTAVTRLRLTTTKAEELPCPLLRNGTRRVIPWPPRVKHTLPVLHLGLVLLLPLLPLATQS